MKPSESSEPGKPKKPCSRVKCAVIGSLFSGFVGLFQWLCSRSDKITATEYAKLHNIDPREVVAAATESRMEPQAFFIQGPDLPAGFDKIGDSVLVSKGAKIIPRVKRW